jgi:hypothetical protein
VFDAQLVSGYYFYDAGVAHFLFGVQDSSNWYELRIDEGNSSLHSYVNGSYTTIGSSLGISLEYGTYRTIYLEWDGTDITVAHPATNTQSTVSDPGDHGPGGYGFGNQSPNGYATSRFDYLREGTYFTNQNSLSVDDGQNTYTLSGFDGREGTEVRIQDVTTWTTDRTVSPVFHGARINRSLTSYSGTVTFNGNPVQGATVYAIDKGNNELISTMTTDSNGDYSFTALDGTPIHVSAQWQDGSDLYNAFSQPNVVSNN